MRRLFLPIVLAIITPGCASNSVDPLAEAALEDAAAGRWAVRLDGKPVIILALERDSTSPGGWSGVSTVATFQMTQEHSFSRINGPGRERSIVWSNALNDGTLEFKVEPDSETYTFRVQPNGTGLMGWKGVSVPPLVLSRAREHEEIPAMWDSNRVYRAEDGHL